MGLLTETGAQEHVAGGTEMSAKQVNAANTQAESPNAQGQASAGGKTGRKWLRRFGTFLMMGGWLLILILGMGIFIAISILLSK